MGMIGKKEKKQEPSMMDKARGFMGLVQGVQQAQAAQQAAQAQTTQEADTFADASVNMWNKKKGSPYRE